MGYESNKDKVLHAVLLDENLMKFGGYTPGEIGNIYQALDSENFVINTVAQIIKRTEENATEKELWKEVNEYLKRNV